MGLFVSLQVHGGDNRKASRELRNYLYPTYTYFLSPPISKGDRSRSLRSYEREYRWVEGQNRTFFRIENILYVRSVRARIGDHDEATILYSNRRNRKKHRRRKRRIERIKRWREEFTHFAETGVVGGQFDLRTNFPRRFSRFLR